MRINIQQRTMDIEERDVNYILTAYLRNYLFYSRNIMPDKIVFPMFASIPVGDNALPIEWVPYLDPAAVEIAFDGGNIPQATEEQIAASDTKDMEISNLRAELASLQQSMNPASTVISNQDLSNLVSAPTPTPVVVTPIDPDRIPRMPVSGDLGPGTMLDGMGSRDTRADKLIAKDLKDEPDIDESEQQELDHEIKQE